MSPLVDTHAHLDRFDRQGRRAETLARAAAQGVGRVITIGTEPEDWARYAAYPSAESGVRLDYTVGLHPCSVEDGWEVAVAQLEKYFAPPRRPVGLGECGLDRFHLPATDSAAAGRIFARQRDAFAAQLALARRLDLPVVVHSRGAFADCVAMVDEAGVDWRRVVFHCFAEGEREMRQLLERGGRGSFGGILTYKNAESVRAACRAQGLGGLMLETDAPYLAPVPHRGQPNEPGLVRHTAECAAGVLGVDLDELARVTTANAVAFFGLAP